MLQLVALTCGAGTDKVLDHGAQVGGVEVAAQSVQGALNALMSVVVHRGDEFLEKGAPGGM